MFSAHSRQRCQEALKYYAGRKFYDSLYYEMVQKYLRHGQRVLDAGCGHDLRSCKHLSDASFVVGIDLASHSDTDNRRSPFGVRGDISRMPFPAQASNMVISRSVVEHLPNPVAVFREFRRVLRPGGKVVVITPNKYDYVSIIAALTPYWVHRRLVSRIFPVTEEDDFASLSRLFLRFVGR